MYNLDIKDDLSFCIRICKQMIKKTMKKVENVKQPERIKRSLKLLWDDAV